MSTPAFGPDRVRRGETGVTVLVVDDHELVRVSMVMALRDQGVSAHACTARTIRGICAEAAEYPAGLVLLDLDLGVDQHDIPVEGSDAVAELRSLGWRVLAVSGSDRRRRARIAAAIAAGAVGQVPKSASFPALVDALVKAVAGIPVMRAEEHREWIELNRRYVAEARLRAELLSRLSVRELLVLDRLADGHRAAEIAAELVLSVNTVRSHIRSIRAKLQVSSQLGAVALLREHEPG